MDLSLVPHLRQFGKAPLRHNAVPAHNAMVGISPWTPPAHTYSVNWQPDQLAMVVMSNATYPRAALISTQSTGWPCRFPNRNPFTVPNCASDHTKNTSLHTVRFWSLANWEGHAHRYNRAITIMDSAPVPHHAGAWHGPDRHSRSRAISPNATFDWHDPSTTYAKNHLYKVKHKL